MTTTLLSTHIQNYLTYCKNQKRLDEKTLKAYRIDLAQFAHAQISSDITDITPDLLEEYVASLHEQYKPRTVKRKIALRDTAVLELLFATGIRISELYSLHNDSIDLQDGTILIYGKGSKERRIQIGNESVLCILKKYKITFQLKILYNSTV